MKLQVYKKRNFVFQIIEAVITWARSPRFNAKLLESYSENARMVARIGRPSLISPLVRAIEWRSFCRT